MSPKAHLALEALVVVAALATVPVVVLEGQEGGPSWLPVADWTLWAIFAGALAVETAAAPRRLAYLRTHPLDVAVVVLSFPWLPGVLAMSRLVRVARVLRVALVAARAMPALRATLGRREFLYVVALCATLVVTAAGALLLLEPHTVGGSFGAALWWSAVTVTTVGYGDIAPVTTGGRLAAAVVMLSGVGLISTLSASIAAYFVDKESQSEMQAIAARLDRIEALLQRRSDDA